MVAVTGTAGEAGRFRGAIWSRGEAMTLSPLGWIAVAALTLAMFWGSVTTMVAAYHVALIVAFATATLQCGSIVLAVVTPKIATVVQLSAIFAIGLATAGEIEWPWPLAVSALIVWCAFQIVIGLHRRWVLSVVGWFAGFTTLVLIIVLNPVQLATPDRWSHDLLIDATVTLLLLGGIVALGQRRSIREQLAAARRDVELEHARRRYGEERSRIARELHDVVAHSMSIVHIQATSARYRIADLSPEAAAEFDSIAVSARSALREMRQLLGALRPDDVDAEQAPQPQIADIPALSAGAEQVGTRVTVSVHPDALALGAVAQLTVYRIVQEALSNAVRHAPGASTEVAITTDEQGTVMIAVTNQRPPSRALATALHPPDTGGMGLVGMRERLALLAGDLLYGQTGDGGFRVVATIPARTPTEERS